MVSIIVPVYNVEKYLPVCIESILNQTLKDLEIILIDDGSTDNSARICDEYAARDSRVVVIHKENGGVVRARNSGLEVAHGEYIGFVDGDDWVGKAMFADLMDTARQEKADIVGLTSYFVNRDGCQTFCQRGIPSGLYNKKGRTINKLLRNLIYVEDLSNIAFPDALWNYVFTKDLIWKHQIEVDPKTKRADDSLCLYSCLIDACKVVMVDRAYYHYRMRGDSIVHSLDNDYFTDISLFYQQLKMKFCQHPASEILMGQLNRYMLYMAVEGINEKFGLGLGLIVPYYLPPQKFLRQYSGKKIALYGAGGVGQSYYRLFQMAESVEIIAWVDRQWEMYRAKGLAVESTSVLTERDYNVILIAVDDVNTAGVIRADLLKLGIPADKVYYGKPRNLIQTV